MTMPSGLLQWGQAGVYNAIDDRMVITALTNGRTGLMRPVLLQAGPGLQVILRGGWMGVADAGDGTSCVVGHRHDVSITVPAGGASARTDILWCDVSPDQAQWTLALLNQSQLPGRAGLLLGQINVPAGASLSSQFGLIPAGVSYGASDTLTTIRTDPLVVPGTHPGMPREVVAMLCGEPGQATDYLIKFTLRGIMSPARSARCQIGFFYRGGIDRLNFTDFVALSNGGPVVNWHWTFATGAGGSPGAPNPWTNVGLVPAGGRWFVTCEGFIRFNPWASFNEPLGVAITINTEPGATVTVQEGAELSLTKPRPNIAWIPPGMS